MSKPIFSKKLRILLTCIPLFGVTNTLFMNYPFGFVEKENLSYSIGIFEIVDVGAPTNHVRLRNIDNQNQYVVFSCSFSPFGNGDDSSCGDTKYLEPYDSQKVTIGWYEIDEFLGSKNEMPQLVTIEKDGKVMRSYEQTSGYIHRIKRGILFVLGPFFMFLVLGFYWFTGKVR